MEHDPHTTSGQSDGQPVPATPSTLACQVCGQYALHEVEPLSDLAEGLGARLECQQCGAHRVLGT